MSHVGRRLAIGTGLAVAAAPRRRTRAGVPPGVARPLAVALLLAALAAGFVVTDPGSAARAVVAAGPDLTRLLRGMAMLKLLMVAAAFAALVWRLGAPARRTWLAAYAIGIVSMGAGPGLIWDMDHVRLGALLLHGGLALTLLLLWRDPAVGQHLADAIERRRRIIADRAPVA